MRGTFKLVVVAVVAGPTLVGVTSASASTGTSRTAPAVAQSTWGPWKNIPVAKPAFGTGCGMHRIEVRDYIQHEKMRTRSLGSGNTAIQFYGRYVIKVIDHTAGTSAVINASGSSLGKNYSIAYKNGDYLYRATGANTIFQSVTHPKAPGLPRNFVGQGRLSVMFFHDQSKTPRVLDRPDTVTNICTLLK